MDLIARPDSDLSDLVPDFLERRKLEAVKMRKAVESGDVATLKYINHDLRGIASPFGFNGLDAISQRISANFENKVEMFIILSDLDFYLENVKVVVD